MSASNWRHKVGNFNATHACLENLLSPPPAFGPLQRTSVAAAEGAAAAAGAAGAAAGAGAAAAHLGGRSNVCV